MMTDPSPAPRPPTCCPLSRVLLLLTLGAYLGLLTDIRLEHVDVVRRHWIPWIPIIYSGAMSLLCLVALMAWRPWTRRIVFWISLAGFIVGGLGFWYHNARNLITPLQHAAQAWYDPKLRHPKDDPPPLAPLAFAGVGLLGMLATAKRSQPPV